MHDSTPIKQSAKYQAEPAHFCFQSRAWAQGRLDMHLLTYAWRYGEDDKLHILRSIMISSKLLSIHSGGETIAC